MDNNNYYNRNRVENFCVVLLQFHESGCLSGIIFECARSCLVYHLSFGLIKTALNGMHSLISSTAIEVKLSTISSIVDKLVNIYYIPLCLTPGVIR